MPATVTATGTAGPGLTVTAAVFNNVSAFTVDSYNKKMLSMTFSDGTPTTYIAIDSATTMTVTISGSNFTVTIS